MNMKKNIKRFFTLDRHASAGFTLVELIVVIAILAILAGVGIPAYSGYIKKANQQADMTLISEIEHALTLAGYNGTFDEGEGGYLILSVNGIDGVDTGSHLEEALIATFGTGYADTLKLKYDSWDNSGLSDGLAGLMAHAVQNSSYMTGNRVDALLGDVEKMTGMAQHLVTSLSSGSGIMEGITLSELFTADVLNNTGKKYGIGEDDWTAEDWDTWGAQEENKVAYGNLLVLAAADDIENHKVDMEYSSASNLIMEFSSYYAFAATNPEFSDTLDAKLDELQNVDGVSAGKDWYTSLEAAAVAAGYDNYRYQLDEDGNKVFSDQYKTDYAAFGSLMTGLGNPSEAQAEIISNDLNNANLFTSGVGNTMYNDYLDTVDAVATICDNEDLEGIAVPAGSIAVMYVQETTSIVLVNSLPAE